MGNASRFRAAGALAAVVLLGACEDVPQTWSRSDIEDIAIDAAADAQTVDGDALQSRLETMQGEIDQLEYENRSLRSELDSLRSEYADHRHY